MRFISLSKREDFGDRLITSIAIPPVVLDTLFAWLLLTALAVFVCGNLLLTDFSVFVVTSWVFLPCVGLIAVFFMFSKLFNSLAWGLVITYGLLLGCVYADHGWSIWCVWLIIGVGLFYMIQKLRIARENWGDALLMALVAATTILATTRSYTSFDMMNRLYVGDVKQDTLFHASIAGMIKNYGVSSTGLNGLIDFPYHVLSHTLMASISLLSGIGVFEVYGIANWVLFAPILIFSVTASCVMLDQKRMLKPSIVWAVACVFLFLLPNVLARWAVWDSFFVSESYLLSLGIFMLSIPLLYKENITFSDVLFLTVATVLISYAKGSVGLVFAALWLAKFVLYRRSDFLHSSLAVTAVLCAVAWVVVDSARAAGSGIAIRPLSFLAHSFLGSYVKEAGKLFLESGWGGVSATSILFVIISLGSFVVFHFLLSWILIGRAIARSSFLVAIRRPAVLYSFVTVFVGLFISLIFFIPGGSAYYFSNIAFFLSLPILIGLVAANLAKRKVAVSRYLMIWLCIVVCAIVLKNFRHHKKSTGVNIASENSLLINSLLAARDKTPTNVVLTWNDAVHLKNPIERCTAQPFLYPAISERPWINVITSGTGCKYHDYGYAEYGINEKQKVVTVLPKVPFGMQHKEWPTNG